MTRNVKTYLLSAKDAYRDARSCEDRIEQLQSEAARITSSPDAVPSGGTRDPHRDAILAALADHLQELSEKQLLFVKRRASVDAFIETLRAGDHRVILRLRYIQMLPWSKVLKKLPDYGMFYEDRNVYRLHARALQEAQEKWDELGQTWGEASAHE